MRLNAKGTVGSFGGRKLIYNKIIIRLCLIVSFYRRVQVRKKSLQWHGIAITILYPSHNEMLFLANCLFGITYRKLLAIENISFYGIKYLLDSIFDFLFRYNNDTLCPYYWKGDVAPW